MKIEWRLRSLVYEYAGVTAKAFDAHEVGWHQQVRAQEFPSQFRVRQIRWAQDDFDVCVGLDFQSYVHWELGKRLGGQYYRRAKFPCLGEKLVDDLANFPTR